MNNKGVETERERDGSDSISFGISSFSSATSSAAIRGERGFLICRQPYWNALLLPEILHTFTHCLTFPLNDQSFTLLWDYRIDAISYEESHWSMDAFQSRDKGIGAVKGVVT